MISHDIFGALKLAIAYSLIICSTTLHVCILSISVSQICYVCVDRHSTHTHTGDRFTVQWNQVHNHDHVNDGPFTFQVSLFQDGSIHFVYREVRKNLWI